MEEPKAKASDIVRVTIIPMNEDGTEDKSKKRTTKSLAVMADSVNHTAEWVWTEEGMPEPVLVEVEVISAMARYEAKDNEFERID